MLQQAAVFKFLIIKLLLLFFSTFCFGQELSSTNYALNSALETKTVYETYLSKSGAFYIATDNGFWSFNGANFTEYAKTGLNTADVTNIQENELGHIFFQNFRGDLFCWNGDSLSLYMNTDQLGFQFDSYLIKGDYIYYWNSQKVAAEHLKSSKLKIISEIKEGGSFQNFYARTFNRQGYFFQFKDYTHYLHFLDNGKLTSVDTLENRGNQHFIADYNGGYCVLIDSMGGCGYIETGKQEMVCDLSGLPVGTVIFNMKEIEGQIFVLTKSGLYLPDKQEFYLKGEIVTNIFKDKEGNYWISTVTNGLFKLTDLSYKLHQITAKHNKSRPDFIFKEEEHFIVSNIKGDLFYYDSTTQDLQLCYKTNRVSRTKNIFLRKTKDQIIHSGAKMLALQNCKAIVDKNGYTTVYQDKENGQFHTTIRNDVISFCLKSDFFFWDYKELVETQEFPLFTSRKYLCNDEDVYRLSIKDCKSVHKLKEWVIALRGDSLYYIHETDFNNIREYPIGAGSLRIYVLESRLWVKFKDRFVEYDLNGKQLGEIPRLNGLEQTINNLSLDEDYIVFSTQRGIFIYDAKTLEYIHQFNSQNGISSVDFNKGWVYDGVLYVNGSQGISEIPLSKSIKKGKPQLQLASVFVNGIKRTGNQFAYTENNIQLKFWMTSFTAEGQLWWRMNGKEWKRLEWPLEIELEALQYGSYLIELYVENNLGAKSDLFSYQFYIDSPFWIKWWFILLLVGLFALALWGIYQLRLERLKAKNKLKNNLIASQMTALKSQMNPHFIFNALNSIQNLIKFERNNEAYTYVNKFATLLRQTLNYSDKDLIPLEYEIELLQDYLDMENMRLEGKLDFKIITKADINIMIPSMIIQPYVENAIKHGLLHKRVGLKKVELSFEAKDELLYCTIVDNGVGRAKAMEFQKQKRHYEVSFSTKATQKRLELLQQLEEHKGLGVHYTDLYSDQGEAQGTKVEIIIPIDSI